jgi:peptide subunit release factor 1 (eRF1)
MYHGIGEQATHMYHGIGEQATHMYHGIGGQATHMYHGIGEQATHMFHKRQRHVHIFFNNLYTNLILVNLYTITIN